MAKFRNAGQTCISANRLFVHKTIFDQFLEKLIEKIKSLKVGNGMDRNDIGPLISSESIKKIIQHIEDSKKKGAKVLLGGNKHLKGDLFFEPTCHYHPL